MGRLHINDQGVPQAEAPIWKETIALFAEAKKYTSQTFPEYIGVLGSVPPSGDSGSFESRDAFEKFGHSVYVPKALLVGLTAGDIIACNIRLNGKGHPQISEPVFKMFPLRRPRASSSHDRSACPMRTKAAPGTFEADWSAFPDELLPLTLAAAGPAELSRSPAVCHCWRHALEGARADLVDFWKCMCAELFPAMMAKILRTELSWSLSCASGSAGSCERAAPGSMISDSWQDKFMQRYGKQLRWEAEKRQQQLLKKSRVELQQGQLAVQDKERGQNAAKARRGQARNQSSAASAKGPTATSDGSTQRTLRAVRVKTCRRCGEKFMPGLNEGDSCHWHRGQYLPVQEDGDVDDRGSSSASSATAAKKVQQLLKANSRKKKSKQHNVELASTLGVSGGEWAWSCCGATNMVEPGCASGPHS